MCECGREREREREGERERVRKSAVFSIFTSSASNNLLGVAVWRIEQDVVVVVVQKIGDSIILWIK